MPANEAGMIDNWKDLRTTLPGLIGAACLLVANVHGHLGAPDWLVQVCSWIASGGLAALGVCATSRTMNRKETSDDSPRS